MVAGAPDATSEALLRMQTDFLSAIELYERVPFYKRVGLVISIANVSLQGWLLYRGMRGWSGVLIELVTVLSAVLVADFLNGLVHLYMDRSSGYRSVVGPFIANFHLHHRIPVYRRRSLVAVWFLESGSKFWLVAYLAAVAWVLPVIQAWGAAWAHFLVLIGVLSSWAEVSHYMCHTTRYRVQGVLEDVGLVLSRRHHSRHHAEDNVNYAFLNGWTNPVLNVVARWVSSGYKTSTDLHSGLYKAQARG